jgi:hypothetical protein
MVVMGAIGTAAFLNGSPLIGWIAVTFGTADVALRVVVVVAVRPALAKATIAPPAPMSPGERERRIRQYVLTYQGTLGVFAIAAIAAAVLLPVGYSIVAWTVTGLLILLIAALSIAAVVGRRRREAAPLS